MDRINGANTVDIGGGRRGFRDVNTVTGVAGTEVEALWLNMIQEEISAVVEDAGIVLDPADWGQLLKALRNRSTARPSWVPVISTTVTAPPAGPALGDRYVVPAGATGAWAGHAYEIAEWTGAAWTLSNHPDGHGVGLPDGRVFIQVGGVYIEKVALDVQSGKWTYAVAGGTSNALTAALTPAPAALSAGMTVDVLVSQTNTDTATFNLNGLGAKALTYADFSVLDPGALKPGLFTFVYDGAGWRMPNFLTKADAVISKRLQNFIIISDQKAAGTSGGTFTAGAWRTRDLQTVVADPQGFIAAGLVAVASNQVTLSAGVWLVEASAPALSVDGHKIRLQNITDATTAVSGTTENTTATGTTDQVQTRSALITTLTLASPKVFQVQHVCISSGTNYGFGISSDYGLGANNGVETYATFKATKLN